jgi:hypothetical protein
MTHHMKTPRPRNTLIILALLTITGGLWFSPSQARGCPSCSESLPSGGGVGDNTTSGLGGGGVVAGSQGSLAQGFYYSILLMLAVPFTLAAGLGGFFYRSARAAAQARLTAPEASSPVPPPQPDRPQP